MFLCARYRMLHLFPFYMKTELDPDLYPVRMQNFQIFSQNYDNRIYKNNLMSNTNSYSTWKINRLRTYELIGHTI